MKKVVQRSGLWQLELTSDELRQGKDTWKGPYYLPDAFSSPHTDMIYLHRPVPFGSHWIRASDFVRVKIKEGQAEYCGPSPATGKSLGVPNGYHRECLELGAAITYQLSQVVPFDFRLLRDLRPEEKILIIKEDNRQEKIRAFKKFERTRRKNVRKLQAEGALPAQITAARTQLPEGYVLARQFFEERMSSHELRRKALELTEMTPFPWLFYQWPKDRPPIAVLDERIAKRIVEHLSL